jgi:prepilin-type processing-associated H-X9-DG protein
MDGVIADGPYVIQGSYGYNAVGSAGDQALHSQPGSKSLGLGSIVPLGQPNLALRENQVAVPADMIALGDSTIPGFAIVHPEFRVPIFMSKPYAPHGSGFNNIFCDGHVENSLREKLFQRTDSSRRRWNRDHEAHPENWDDGLGAW